MSQSKPKLTLSGDIGPNPLKVALVLHELGLEYETVNVDTTKNEQKSPEFLKLNPNGRVPVLVDHNNNDFTIWESGAILLYLIEKYDPEHKLSVEDPEEHSQLLQWLFFQNSGQGPYFGQAMWFLRYHHERVPSAIERYQKEILRVFGVLDNVLSKQEWLVGGKMTIADLAFLPWNYAAIYRGGLDQFEGGVDVEKQFPAFYEWHFKLAARPYAAEFLKQRQAVRAAARAQGQTQ
ncbi:glutathione S-transferase C-terminal-like protein [Pilatotrama ljubarskyi]|nr:glutathione S-transferase C-terminal-like protein [Pilatotrama ljubarskyi]